MATPDYSNDVQQAGKPNWEIVFTDHTFERYSERFKNIDRKAIDGFDIDDKGRLINRKLEKEIRRNGVFYYNAEGQQLYCAVNNLTIYSIKIDSEGNSLLVTTGMNFRGSLKDKLKRLPRINIPDIGKQASNAWKLEEVLAKVQVNKRFI